MVRIRIELGGGTGISPPDSFSFRSSFRFRSRSSSTVWVKKFPWGRVAIFPKRLGIFEPNFTCLLCIPIHARLRIFIQISASLTKLCHIKRDHPVKIMCAKCPPSAKTHFLTFPKLSGIFSLNFTRLLNIHTYARMQIFVQLSSTVTKLCHIKCDHPACVPVDGGHSHYGGRA